MQSPVRSLLVIALLAWIAPGAWAQTGELKLEIYTPGPDVVLPSSEQWIEVEGGASTLGGVRELDMFFVMDTSSSLSNSDPDDARKAGAIGLVESLHERSDTRIGVVEFDKKPKLVLPLTSDRAHVVEALQGLDQRGSTNLAGGLSRALAEFRTGARPDASRVMLVFSDGVSKDRHADSAIRRVADQARKQGVAIHALSLGANAKGGDILRRMAQITGGSFVRVTDPALLAEAFLNLRTTGVDFVTLRVGDGAPVTAELAGSSFRARVPLAGGENRIVAEATSMHGQKRSETVMVTVRDPGCAELHVEAENNGKPALSISERAVEIVFDASRSMWGRMEGQPKMAVAKQILHDALEWMPPDLNLSLRAYGHQHSSQKRNCQDTQLLVPLSQGSRAPVRAAIDGLRPAGQTPISYALEQVARDLQSFRGERAVVLVTDGIESCGGDPVAAARALQANGPTPVHVIGFGLASDEDEDVASLRAIAEASGGRFLTAGSSGELRDALSTMVGTTYRVWRDNTPVAEGALGSDTTVHLPAGDYLVRLESAPPQALPLTLENEEQVRLVFEREARAVSHREERAPAEYAACVETALPVAGIPPSEWPGAGMRPGGMTATAAGTPGPAAPAAATTGTTSETAEGPRAKKVSSLAIPDGSVEIWQNLRPNRKADYGVVLRHPSTKKGVEMLWSGNDLEQAREAAERKQIEMQWSESPPGTTP